MEKNNNYCMGYEETKCLERLQVYLELYQVYEDLLPIVESDKDNETIQQAMLYLKADISKELLELSKNIIKQHKGEE